MEELQSPIDKQTMVSSFLEIAVGQTADTARQFLQVNIYVLTDIHLHTHEYRNSWARCVPLLSKYVCAKPFFNCLTEFGR